MDCTDCVATRSGQRYRAHWHERRLRYIHILAAVRPGNSGAAIRRSGRVMGVVAAKLNALAFAHVTGDIPQNVNFANKVATLESFLDARKVAYSSDIATRQMPNTQRADRAEAGSALP